MTPRIDNEARIDVLTDAVAELIAAAQESASFVFTRDIDANTWMALPPEVADAVARLCLVRDRLSAALARFEVQP